MAKSTAFSKTYFNRKRNDLLHPIHALSDSRIHQCTLWVDLHLIQEDMVDNISESSMIAQTIGMGVTSFGGSFSVQYFDSCIECL